MSHFTRSIEVVLYFRRDVAHCSLTKLPQVVPDRLAVNLHSTPPRVKYGTRLWRSPQRSLQPLLVCGWSTSRLLRLTVKVNLDDSIGSPTISLIDPFRLNRCPLLHDLLFANNDSLAACAANATSCLISATLVQRRY